MTTTTPSDRSVTPRPSSSSSALSSASRSNSIQQTLHSISEQPNNDNQPSEKRYRQRSEELSRKQPVRLDNDQSSMSNLSRKESMNSSTSSSVGYDANFPPPPSSAYDEQLQRPGVGVEKREETQEEVPDDIKITMQKIRHSSRDPLQSPPQSAAEPPKPEPEIELIPEPATDKLPDAYFQPNFIADLRLNMRDDTPVSVFYP